MSMVDIKVSVIIPVYKTEKYIIECLDSVVCQTLKEIEIICIDDASPDTSDEIIKGYMEQDGRIQYFRNEKNKGLSFCRNLGISKSKGKYIQFLDSDDYLVPNALERLWSVAETNQLEVLVTDHETEYETLDGRDPTKFDLCLCGSVMDGKSLFVKETACDAIIVTSVTQFVLRKFLLRENIKFYEGIYHEDHLYSYYVRKYAKRTMAIAEKPYVYRIRESSITTGGVSDRHIQGILRTILEIEKANTEEINSEFYRATNFYIDILKNILYQKVICCVNDIGFCKLDADEQQLLWNVIEKKMYHPFRKAYTYICEKKPEEIIIYGAGQAARTLIYLLEERGIAVDKVAVTDIAVNKRYLYGYEINQIDELVTDKSNASVFIAVQSENLDMLNKAKSLGFKYIVPLW